MAATTRRRVSARRIGTQFRRRSAHPAASPECSLSARPLSELLRLAQRRDCESRRSEIARGVDERALLARAERRQEFFPIGGDAFALVPVRKAQIQRGLFREERLAPPGRVLNPCASQPSFASALDSATCSPCACRMDQTALPVSAAPRGPPRCRGNRALKIEF